MTWHLERTRVRVWIVDENGNLVTRISSGRTQKEDEAFAAKIVNAVTRLPLLENWIQLYQHCLTHGHKPVIIEENGNRAVVCSVCNWKIGTIEQSHVV